MQKLDGKTKGPLLIIAGAYHQAQDFARKYSLGRETVDWQYISDHNKLRGTSGARIAFVGTYRQHHHYREISEVADYLLKNDRATLYSAPKEILPSVQLFSGGYFHYLEPWKSEFKVADIAHALSNKCRFNGHTSKFYSVAQHSVLLSRNVSRPSQKPGLFHDATEFVMGDVVSPLKRLLPDYKSLYKSVEEAIFEHFCMSPILPDEVKEADMRMLATERRDLMRPDDNFYYECLIGVEPYPDKIEPWTPGQAFDCFMERYRQLGGSNDD